MKKLVALGLISILLTACASDPYGQGQSKGYFLGQANITSNVPNLCTATNGQYAFKANQYWIAGGSGMSWYGCTATHQSNLQPAYAIDYYIIKNDGTGKNIVAACTPMYQGNGSNIQFTNMQVQVQLGNPPTCKMILN